MVVAVVDRIVHPPAGMEVCIKAKMDAAFPALHTRYR
jgi:hypothetical protein